MRGAYSVNLLAVNGPNGGGAIGYSGLDAQQDVRDGWYGGTGVGPLSPIAHANNIFNTYPDQQVKAANLNSGRFVYSRRVTQFGMNGGFYYGRLQLSL
jgi:hypothetical protein